MNKLEKELFTSFNSTVQMGSWLGFLRCAYEVASEKRNYKRCDAINDLIVAEINN